LPAAAAGETFLTKALPINRTHPFLAATVVDRNAFPREVLAEAIAGFVEEDRDRRPSP
jgi:hypothetical protein